MIGVDPDELPEGGRLRLERRLLRRGASTQLGTGRWLIANGIYAAQHNLVVGQAVLLDTPNGPRTYHLAGHRATTT